MSMSPVLDRLKQNGRSPGRSFVFALVLSSMIIFCAAVCSDNEQSGCDMGSASDDLRVTEPLVVMPTPTLFPKNRAGFTVGSLADVPSGLDLWQSYFYAPDLIAVEAESGGKGFVWKAELFRLLAEEGLSDCLSVFDIDGKTRIGVFEVKER